MRRLALFLLIMQFAPICVAQQDRSKEADQLFQAGKRLDALPLYEQLAKDNPSEMIYAERLSDCYLAKSIQFDASTQKDELIRYKTLARDYAKKAVALGDKTVYIRMIADSDPTNTAPLAPESIASGLLNDGEKAFTAGDYQGAYEKYVAAVELDPRLYLGALYAGDAAYTQHDLANASKWFARAISIDPDRETAYRYWGDAITKYGNDPMGAREKYIQAIIAEPYNSLAWLGVKQWAEIENAIVQAPKIERPTGAIENADDPKNIKVIMDPDFTNEQKQPGSSAWVEYMLTRAHFQTEEFKKEFPNEKEYRHTLAEEHEALSAVAEAVKAKHINQQNLDESLRNLLMLFDAGMLDCWILISNADEGISHDYPAYRKDHRQLLHEYLDKYVVRPGTTPGK